jgi:hypothetical protein
MFGNRFIWMVVVVVAGTLQAWDSGVLRSTTFVQALVALAIVTPAATLALTRQFGTQAAAVAAAFVLLTVARAIAPASLPTLHLIAFVPALIILMGRTVRQSASA